MSRAHCCFHLGCSAATEKGAEIGTLVWPSGVSQETVVPDSLGRLIASRNVTPDQRLYRSLAAKVSCAYDNRQSGLTLLDVFGSEQVDSLRRRCSSGDYVKPKPSECSGSALVEFVFCNLLTKWCSEPGARVSVASLRYLNMHLLFLASLCDLRHEETGKHLLFLCLHYSTATWTLHELIGNLLREIYSWVACVSCSEGSLACPEFCGVPLCDFRLRLAHEELRVAEFILHPLVLNEFARILEENGLHRVGSDRISNVLARSTVYEVERSKVTPLRGWSTCNGICLVKDAYPRASSAREADLLPHAVALHKLAVIVNTSCSLLFQQLHGGADVPAELSMLRSDEADRHVDPGATAETNIIGALIDYDKALRLFEVDFLKKIAGKIFRWSCSRPALPLLAAQDATNGLLETRTHVALGLCYATPRARFYM